MTDPLLIDSLSELPDVRYCRDAADPQLRRRFLAAIEGLNAGSIFNPSFFEGSGVSVFAFRAVPDGSRDQESFVSITSPDGRRLEHITPQRYPELNVPRLIDPKIFTRGKEVWVTFNSGWVPDGGNDVFVMRVFPTISSPKRVFYTGRRAQERNWAFFSHDDGVYAIYRIAPQKILRLDGESRDGWRMVDHSLGSDATLPDDLTLGTQPSRMGNRYYFMAHRKYKLRWQNQRRKVYLGRPCMLDPGTMKISLGGDWMVHSVEALSGSETRPNSNLHSCTYFSGLQASQSGIRLGYGINDLDFGFSHHTFAELFGRWRE